MPAHPCALTEAPLETVCDVRYRNRCYSERAAPGEGIAAFTAVHVEEDQDLVVAPSVKGPIASKIELALSVAR